MTSALSAAKIFNITDSNSSSPYFSDDFGGSIPYFNNDSGGGFRSLRLGPISSILKIFIIYLLVILATFSSLKKFIYLHIYFGVGK